VLSWHVSQVRLLLEYGADVNYVNRVSDPHATNNYPNYRGSALDVACRYGHAALGAWLARVREAGRMGVLHVGAAVPVGASAGADRERASAAGACVSRQGALIGPAVSWRPAKHACKERPAALARPVVVRYYGGGGPSAEEEAAAAAETAAHERRDAARRAEEEALWAEEDY